MNNCDIEIIGKENIGDKARDLLEKTPKLREIGFYTPRRVVLAEDFFDPFFQRNKLGNTLRDVKYEDNLEEKVRKGTINRPIFWPLHDIAASFKGWPLVIRSSAEGDSRGTGIYKSGFTENNMLPVLNTFQDVLASYFSKDAVLFRKDAKTGEGFAVIIEPLIGQLIREYIYVGSVSEKIAPILSGFGYTSTSREGSYIIAVPGIGGGVETRKGEKLSRTLLEPHKGQLIEYLFKKRKDIKGLSRTKPLRNSSLLKTDRSGNDSYSAKVYEVGCYSSKDPLPERGNIRRFTNSFLAFEGNLLLEFYHLNLNPFFDMIEKIEEAFGPQYFEWAMTLEDKPKYWITQIADINKKLDFMDFTKLGKVLFEGHTVTGTGERICDKIAFIQNPEEVDSLYKFNQKNKDYLLIFTGILTSGSKRKSLEYHHYNNASVLLEIQNTFHRSSSIGHLDGRLAEANKFFGVLDTFATPPKELDKRKIKGDYKTTRIYSGQYKVISSERQNKLIVSALD